DREWADIGCDRFGSCRTSRLCLGAQLAGVVPYRLCPLPPRTDTPLSRLLISPTCDSLGQRPQWPAPRRNYPMTASQPQLDAAIADLDRLRETLKAARTAIGSAVVGQESVVDLMLIALMAGGHVLLEGPPGVGKTLLVRTLATVAGLSFARVQFTPDLMPADITGASVLVPNADGRAHLEF